MIPIGEAAAAVVDHAATICEVRQRFAALDQHNAPLDVPLVRWRQMLRDSREFIDQQLAFLALEYHWTVPQLWGANAVKPYARIDQQGLLWLVNGSTIDDLGAGYCVLLNGTGTRTTYRVRTVPLDDTVLPWELIQ
jgi:hypothetical protein